MRAVPRGHGAPTGGTRAAGRRRSAHRRAADARRARAGDARRVDLRPRADRRERRRICDREPWGVCRMTTLLTAKKMIELSVDGRTVRVFEGSTILDACRQLGI